MEKIREHLVWDIPAGFFYLFVDGEVIIVKDSFLEPEKVFSLSLDLSLFVYILCVC